MVDYNKLNREFLPKIEAGLEKVRSLQNGEGYDVITDIVSNVSLSPDEKLKLRRRLYKEFHYPPDDFTQAFGCRFSLTLWEKVGRGN